MQATSAGLESSFLRLKITPMCTMLLKSNPDCMPMIIIPMTISRDSGDVDNRE